MQQCKITATHPSGRKISNVVSDLDSAVASVAQALDAGSITEADIYQDDQLLIHLDADLLAEMRRIFH